MRHGGHRMKPPCRKVLLVDDDEHLLAGLSRNLRKVFVVRTAPDAVAGLACLRDEGPFAVVVSDLKMPGMDGIEFLSIVRNSSPTTVRVMLTGHADLQVAMEAVNTGHVFRFLEKPCPPEMLREVLDQALREHERVDLERSLAHEDPFLDIGNRRGFEVAIRRFHSHAVRHRRTYTIVMVDVDHFKQYNDLYGHQAGDQALIDVATAIRRVCRTSDEVYRYGGEEFVLLLSEAALDCVHEVCLRHLSAVERLGVEHTGTPPGVLTISAGAASFDPAAGSAPAWEDILAEADRALYAAKAAGRNRCVVATTVTGRDPAPVPAPNAKGTEQA